MFKKLSINSKSQKELLETQNLYCYFIVPFCFLNSNNNFILFSNKTATFSYRQVGCGAQYNVVCSKQIYELIRNQYFSSCLYLSVKIYYFKQNILTHSYFCVLLLLFFREVKRAFFQKDILKVNLYKRERERGYR